jgi:hypothetical protein
MSYARMATFEAGIMEPVLQPDVFSRTSVPEKLIESVTPKQRQTRPGWEQS